MPTTPNFSDGRMGKVSSGELPGLLTIAGRYSFLRYDVVAADVGRTLSMLCNHGLPPRLDPAVWYVIGLKTEELINYIWADAVPQYPNSG